ncbi:MAG: DUF1015 domain-containing protein [Planctomycetaceae bacterium]|nr:DUF1015 domain-containing protein [Planctomycetaceae bacterium]
MPNIQAFRGLRYDLGVVGSLADVVAPPYDVINSAQQDLLYARHPKNVVRLILNREEPGDVPNAKYQRAGHFLRSWQNDGTLALDSQPMLYVYHQSFTWGGQTFTRRGFLCRVRLEPFGTGKIYPHEETHSKAKQDRFLLTTATRTNLSPVFGMYPDPDNSIQMTLDMAVAATPPVEATDDLGVVHRLYLLPGAQVQAKIAQMIADREVYIADGHHRYETACNYSRARQEAGDHHPDCDYVLMMLVGMDDPGLIVLPTHRLFRGIAPIDQGELVRRVGTYFEVTTFGHGPAAAAGLWEQIEVGGSQETLGIFTAKDDCWSRLELTAEGMARLAEIAPEHCEDWRGLGVSILHRLLMDDCLEAAELTTPKYVHSVDEVVDGLVRGDEIGRDATGQSGDGQPFQLAALVMPARVQDIESVSQYGERMPAKSTYFYPKLLSGLVFNPLG